ncbi:AAA family ATPase [Shewanella baltica]|uniref:AAA family ATPase n=1 Tax=Shewanella baltica TaxID=62322 RepID=UPI0002185B41|nr:ATP-binding protein [Shewanella baltica]AEH15436.1 AAA ATPase central domain protein [Shewanella baltica OS117]
MNSEQIVNIARLSLEGKESDVRLYVAKLVRTMRKTEPETAVALENLLKVAPARSSSVLRKASPIHGDMSIPSTDENLTLLKSFEGISVEEPLLNQALGSCLEQVISERQHSSALLEKGLRPTSSLIFQGPPGVGKTITARWLSSKLNLPFYVLDLTSVMSSFLGKTGNNLRAVIEFAKTHPCVLLLDEIDAIAKKRSDEADVGELKRLVTIMLQELENWPSDGLLIAATNHPELVDPALWRRFDMEISFENPNDEHVRLAVNKFLGQDLSDFGQWVELLVDSLKGTSYSNIKRTVLKLRKLKLINPKSFEENALNYLLPDVTKITRTERISLALKLVSDFGIPKQKAAKLTQVSRDTIRKKINEVTI